MAVKLLTDSTAYIDQSLLKELDIRVVPLSVHFPDEFFPELDVDYDYFYNKIESSGVIPFSSQPSPGQIAAIFEEIVAAGDEVLGIFISSAISGTRSCAEGAKEIVLEKYPGACIEIVESYNVCMALGLQVVEAARLAKNGGIMAEAIEAAKQVRDTVHFYFTPLTLDYLEKGGRIGGAAALLGSLLKIKPILYMTPEGTIDVLEKVRGVNNALEHMIKLMQKDVKARGLRHLVVHHVNDPEQGQVIARKLSDLYQLNDLPVYSAGPVIGLHVGPGCFGFVYTTQDK